MNIELEKCSGTEITLTQCLFLRAIFEELTRNYNMPDGSDIDTIKWFIKNGNKSNSLRGGCVDICFVNSSNSLVLLPMAETTTTTENPDFVDSTIRFATR